MNKIKRIWASFLCFIIKHKVIIVIDNLSIHSISLTSCGAALDGIADRTHKECKRCGIKLK